MAESVHRFCKRWQYSIASSGNVTYLRAIGLDSPSMDYEARMTSFMCKAVRYLPSLYRSGKPKSIMCGCYASVVVQTDQSTIMLHDLHAHTLVVEGQLMPNRGGRLSGEPFIFVLRKTQLNFKGMEHSGSHFCYSSFPY
jgi:hypothetical protein